MCRIAGLIGYELTGATTPMRRELYRGGAAVFGDERDMDDPHMQSEYVYKRIASIIAKGCEELVSRCKTER